MNKKKAVGVIGTGVAIVAVIIATAGGGSSSLLSFSSGVSGATYECSVDSARYKPCTSPYAPAVKPGTRVVHVRASLVIPQPETAPTPTTTQSTSTTSSTTTSGTTTTSTSTSSSTPVGVGCYGEPGACGYPTPTSVGAPGGCSALTPSGPLALNAPGQTVEGKLITGTVTVSAANVTLQNDCVGANGGSGSHVVFLAGGATGFKILHSDVYGAPNVQEALNDNNGEQGALAESDYLHNCGECVHGEWRLVNSYVDANASISGEHYEDVYCSDTTFIAEHDVLINPYNQTADLFCDTHGGSGGPADNHITLTKSLLAGGGYSLYAQSAASSVGTSSMTVTDNRFARCLSTPVFESGPGGTRCRSGADSGGIWPNGGYYGTDAYTYCSGSQDVWSRNVWDDDGSTVGC